MKIEDFVVYDIETAKNRTIVGFRGADGRHEIFDLTESMTTEQADRVRAICADKTLVGFNNDGFDTYLLYYLITRNARPIDVFDLGQAIITARSKNMRSWQVAKNMNAQRSGFNEIDLMNFAPGKTKLKVFEVRMGMSRVVTLPFDPEQPIEDDAVTEVIEYLMHDLDATWLLLEKVFEEIEIRQSLSDLTGVTGLLQKPPAGAAEAVIVENYCRVDTEIDRDDIRALASRFRNCNYELTIQDWVKKLCEGTKAGELITQIEGITFDYTDGKMKQDRKPPTDFEIAGTRYSFGKGGIHSEDTPGFSEGEGTLLDIDVASYYPSLMMRPGGAPAHLNEELFQETFGGILKARLDAKAAGRKKEASALKLVVNSIFGKMGAAGGDEPGARSSLLFSPPSLYAITFGGQLSLLALAERITDGSGSYILSANTDGLLIKLAPGDEPRVMSVIADWERETGFTMEANHLKAYRRLSVNDYIAVGVDGSVKSKGSLNCEPGLTTTPDEVIVARSIAAWMKDGTPVRETIESAAAARDLFAFSTTLTTNGAGFRVGEKTYGGVVRVYRSSSSVELIVTAASGKSPEKTNRKPYRIFENLNDWPDDLDVEAYVTEAESIITKTSVEIDPALKAKTFAEVERLRSHGFEVCGISPNGEKLPAKDVTGGLRLGVVVAPRHFLVSVSPGVMGEETLALVVHERGTVLREIHSIEGMKEKVVKHLRDTGAMTNGFEPVFGEGLAYYTGRAKVAEKQITLTSAGKNGTGMIIPEEQPETAPKTPVFDAVTATEVVIDNNTFISAIFGDASDIAYVVSTTVPPDTKDENAKRGMWLGGPVRFAHERHLDPDANNYCAISTFTPNEDGEYHRTSGSFSALHCVMLDDINTKVGEPASAGFGPPTARIETSRGNYQLVYRLREPLTDQGMAEALIEAVTRNPEAPVTDKGSGGINRVFRLPVAFNNKEAYGETPFRVRLVEWRPEVSYTPEEIASWVGVKKLVPLPTGAKVGVAEESKAMTHPIVEAFRSAGKLLAERPKRSGWIDVECPWSEDHTGRKDDGAAVIVRENGTWGFRCQHGHCSEVKMVMIGDRPTPVLTRNARLVADTFRAAGAKVTDPGRAIWGSAELREAGANARASATLDRANEGEMSMGEEEGEADEDLPPPQDEVDPEEAAAEIEKLLEQLGDTPTDVTLVRAVFRALASIDELSHHGVFKKLNKITGTPLRELKKAYRVSHTTTGNGGGNGGGSTPGDDEGSDFDDLSHSEMGERFVDAMMRGGVRPVTDGGRMYRYSPEGIWTELTGEEARSDIYVRFRGQKKNVLQHHASGIFKVATDISTIANFFGAAPAGVCAPSSFWKIEGDEVVETEHSPNNRSQHLLKYDPDFSGDPDTFLRVLREGLASPSVELGLVSAEADALAVDEQIRMLRQLFGATLMGLMPKFQRAVFLMGAAASFKSGTLSVLQSLFDPRAVESLSAKQFGEKFMLSELFGKRLNVVGEAEHDYVIPAAEFKTILGGDTITAHRKHGQPFKFVNKAAMWFAGNHVYKTKDNTDGFWRRWAIIKFKTTTPASRRELGLIARILEEEGGKIIGWAMGGALDILENGLVLSSDHLKEVTRWSEDSSSVASWLADTGERFAPAPRGKNKPLRTTVGFELYRSWCEASGRTPYMKQNFYLEMERLGHMRTKTGGHEVFKDLSAS